MKAAILNDITKCIGCRACVMACKQVNGLPPGGGDKLSAISWCVVEEYGHASGAEGARLHVRRQCRHCEDPACASVCPVAALEKTELGPVIYHEERCIGCRYCMAACPFQIPTYEWAETAPRVRKCIMCYHKRVSMGLPPACTAACPTGATRFGDRSELLAEANVRIHDNPGRYVPHVYGETEAGGTSVFYLSPVPFEQVHLRRVQNDPYPRLTWSVLSKLPTVVSVAGVGLLGLSWMIRRRDELAAQAHEEAAASADGAADTAPHGHARDERDKGGNR